MTHTTQSSILKTIMIDMYHVITAYGYEHWLVQNTYKDGTVVSNLTEVKQLKAKNFKCITLFSNFPGLQFLQLFCNV